jgi:hypothetical protein
MHAISSRAATVPSLPAVATGTAPAAVARSRPGGEAPLRLTEASRRSRDVRLDAGRQLRTSLWLILVIGVAFAATLAARPNGNGSALLQQEPVAVQSHEAASLLAMTGRRFAHAEAR